MDSSELSTIVKYINIKSSEQISDFGRKMMVKSEKSVRIVNLFSHSAKTSGSGEYLGDAATGSLRNEKVPRQEVKIFPSSEALRS